MAAKTISLVANIPLVAIDHLRVTSSNRSELMAACAPGDQISVHAFRHDELLVLDVTLDARVELAVQLRPAEQADEDSVARRARWLHQDESAA